MRMANSLGTDASDAAVRVNSFNCQPQGAFELGDLPFEDL
jgi:hypothetical protein